MTEINQTQLGNTLIKTKNKNQHHCNYIKKDYCRGCFQI